MKCPHCNKEVFGRCHDVDDLYEEPKELTHEEQLQEENEELRQKIKEIGKMTGWVEKKCGCCDGLMWCKEGFVECKSCNGAGFYFIHIKSGVEVEYPGGRLLGKLSIIERETLLKDDKG